MTHHSDNFRREAGLKIRREVLSDAHVDRVILSTAEISEDYQDLLNRTVWGDIWSRPGLERRDRSIAAISSLIATGYQEELSMHIRAGVRNGLTPDEIKEVALQSAIYAGFPAANSTFRIINAILG